MINGIAAIIYDENARKKAKRLKKIGISDYRYQHPTMSLSEVRRIIGIDDGLVKTNNHFPQIVDVEEF